MINYLAVLVCAIVSMVIGSIWFGPLFGKKWMEITGCNDLSPEEIEKRKKASMKLYAIQFFLSLLQIAVLAYYIQANSSISALSNSLWLWLGFLLPTIAGGSLWYGDTKKVAWMKFFINVGYQLVISVIIGLILGAWR